MGISRKEDYDPILLNYLDSIRPNLDKFNDPNFIFNEEYHSYTYKGKKLESVVSHKATGFNKVSVTDAIYNELKNDDEVFGKIMEAISKKSVMSEIWKIKITSDKVSKVSKEKNNIAMAEELLNDE